MKSTVCWFKIFSRINWWCGLRIHLSRSAAAMVPLPVTQQAFLRWCRGLSPFLSLMQAFLVLPPIAMHGTFTVFTNTATPPNRASRVLIMLRSRSRPFGERWCFDGEPLCPKSRGALMAEGSPRRRYPLIVMSGERTPYSSVSEGAHYPRCLKVHKVNYNAPNVIWNESAGVVGLGMVWLRIRKRWLYPKAILRASSLDNFSDACL